jgi:hypothetical protein
VDAVDRPVPGCGDQPRTGVGGLALARPALRGDRKGIRRGLLGEVEIAAEEADQRREDTPPLVAEDVLENG